MIFLYLYLTACRKKSSNWRKFGIKSISREKTCTLHFRIYTCIVSPSFSRKKIVFMFDLTQFAPWVCTYAMWGNWPWMRYLNSWAGRYKYLIPWEVTKISSPSNCWGKVHSMYVWKQWRHTHFCFTGAKHTFANFYWG